ncbi:MAG: TatD family hydrolase [Gammaproteobacteria bacterium]|nr:TatD family hydrolase [Gammaproteobacteria bacterium]
MIDIGANLLDPVFDADRQEVLRRAGAAGIDAIVLTGTSIASSRAAVGFASRRRVGRRESAGESSHDPSPRLFATAGVHPHDAKAVEAGWDHEIAELADRAEVVAIGETGLDYHRDFSPRDVQQGVFRRQVELAVRLKMPLFVHDRDSQGATRTILSDYRDELAACVIHCFTGTAADLDGYIDDGYYIGITGWICDERRGRQLMDMVRRIPGDRLMIETDAPYLLPRNMVPRPRSRRNEPAFLTWVAQRVARCRDEDLFSVERQTRVNAMRFFGLP